MDANYTLNALCRAAEKLSNGEFHIDEDNVDAVETVACWLARRGCEGMDPNKGILLIGNVGSGKTLLMRAASRVISDAYGVRAFGVKSCAELVRMFNQDGYGGDLDRWIDAPHICLDDMGTEGEAIHFGKRTNLIGEIIEARYDRLMRGSKTWTNITTNLGADAIRANYGERVYSRITHMCNVIGVGVSADAIDRRKNAPAPKQPPSTGDVEFKPNIYDVPLHPDLIARLRAAGIGKNLGGTQRTGRSSDRLRAQFQVPEHAMEEAVRFAAERDQFPAIPTVDEPTDPE